MSSSVSELVGSSNTRILASDAIARAISTNCCLAIGSRPTGVSSGKSPCESRRKRRPCNLPLLSLFQPAEPRPLLPEQDVCFDREVRREIQFLINHRDAGAERIDGPRGSVWLPLDDELTGIGAINAGQDLHQRGLAGAVLADQRSHLLAFDLERHVD